jgi:tRNA (guanine-N7-)-methyltransferase
MEDPTTIRRLYGRRQGHKLRAGQAALVEELLPEIDVPESGPLDARTLFGDGRPLELEIGFGAGEHLAWQAGARPEHGFIGCEPFLNGVVGALTKIEAEGIGNVRIHMGDAIEVLERLPDASLSRAYLLHPDPWPKARHAKRRFMNHGPIGLIAAKLKPGGIFRFGTDHPVYLRWAMMVMGAR